MTRFLSLILLLAACFFSSALVAQDPIISIQGTLKDANGAAVADGEQNMTFRLYHQETGGEIKYEESATVSVVGGIYSHNLGSIVDMPDSIFRTNIYLGVSVGDLELTPRTTMTYAPYALSVRAAQRVAQGGCSGQVGDIKYSILDPEAFAEENGDCWVPLDGRTIAAGNALRDDHGIVTLPDMSGLFMRATEYNIVNSTTGEDADPSRSPNSSYAYQTDENKAHDHDFSGTTDFDGQHNHTYRDQYTREGDSPTYELGFTTTYPSSQNPSNGDGDGTRGHRADNTEGDSRHSHNFSGTTDAAGVESRPKNMNFYLYIRVD
ncbi:MAG: hypothetical protein AAF828_12435 [Bacteroidota bacterium]